MKKLVPYGCTHVQHTPGLWINKEQNATFSLVVDVFGIKYDSLNNFHYLINTHKVKHTIVVDMTGNSCIGVALNWNYNKREVTSSTPDFYPSLLRKVNHQLSSKPQHSLFLEPHVTCGKHVQLSPDPDASPKLDEKGTKFVKSIFGVALCVGHLIDNTILVATNEIGIQ